MRKSRRKFLTTASSIAAVPTMSGLGSAEESNRNQRYIGITYDPVTQQITGSSSAKLTTKGRVLKGSIKISDNFAIPISFSGPHSIHQIEEINRAKSHYSEKRGGSASLGHRPLKLNLTAVDNGDITGVVKHPGAEDQVGFALRAATASSKDDIKNRLSSIVQNRGGEQ